MHLITYGNLKTQEENNQSVVEAGQSMAVIERPTEILTFIAPIGRQLNHMVFELLDWKLLKAPINGPIEHK